MQAMRKHMPLSTKLLSELLLPTKLTSTVKQAKNTTDVLIEKMFWVVSALFDPITNFFV